jgi:dual specificity tyrosine-phosphorylation-regulated kinase 2/3/4
MHTNIVVVSFNCFEHGRRSNEREVADKPRNGNMDSSAPAFGNTPNRTYLAQPAEHFKNPPADVSTGSPVATASRNTTDFDFIPPVNFDDFQSRLANFDGSSSLLNEFPAVGGGRVLPNEQTGGMAARNTGFADSRPTAGRTQELQNERGAPGVLRSASYKHTFGGGVAPRVPVGQTNIKEPTPSTQTTVPLRTRRQSSVPQSASTFGQALPSNPTKQPRKSIGPGLFSNIIDRKPVPQSGPPVPSESSKPPVVRSGSFSKVRRTMIQPSASAGAELPRVSTLTATTQSRQAKVRSVAAPGREGEPTVSVGRSPAKISVHRATTPTSSTTNKRQSVASGRMSGLGARTISPTDARRLKRLSTVNPPPMPTNMPRQPPAPQDDDPVMPPRLPELPRFGHSSESFIPRKPSASHSLTPTSARTSPDMKNAMLKSADTSLSNRSSYQSLMTNPNTSSSRLPQLKNRNVHSSSAQYGEESEAIPPVPAIPKNYDSPKEREHCFFSNSRKSSVATSGENSNAPEGSGTLAAPSAEAGQLSRSSFDLPTLETPRKATHRRNQTIGSPTASTTPAAKPRNQPESTGRRNNTLQPLRLPPLNLLPLTASLSNRSARNAVPTGEADTREQHSTAQTPEPKRVPKTPSTPMTASKATFFRRQEREREAAQKQLRSASSQNALRDMMGFDESVSRFFDDSDPEPVGAGIPIQASKQQQPRSAITPFASGSLPKHSNEFVRLRGRPSGEYKADAQQFNLATYDNLRLQTGKPQPSRQNNSGTGTSYKTANETPGSEDSPVAEQAPPLVPEVKKESGGLRRKLSLGWRRSSSKGANHPENKSSPQEMPSEKPKATIRAIPKPGTMPPPRLPASATWSGELPSLPSSLRPSLELARKKSYAGLSYLNGNSGSNSEQESQAPAPPPKTRALHSEQPQPVANRASSWGNFSFGNRAVTAKVQANGPAKPKPTAPVTISAIIKDKDDFAADEEMRRLSQKRRDVDQAARETEVLKRRAVPRNPMSPEQVLHDRNCTLNIFERGEIMDYDKDGVYFTGTKDARKIIGSVSSLSVGDKEKSGNHGYDDERGDYNIVFGDHLAYRYEVIDVLGKGSFGQVVRCVDHKDGGIVAVKIIRNKKRFHQQALVEVGILGRLRDWVRTTPCFPLL